MSEQADIVARPPNTLHRCMACGCLWRQWSSDGSWSLADAHQKSCRRCDNSPEFLSLLDPPPGALATAEAAALERAAWQPIETAPKDRRCLVWVEWLDTPGAVIAEWSSTQVGWVPEGQSRPTPHATHWAPLLPAPGHSPAPAGEAQREAQP